MRNVKLQPGNCVITPLERDIFEEKTGFKPPYYTEENIKYPFAVCPQCDNPVKIIGFYNDIKPKPYAEHYDNDVEELVDFIAENKEYCPYYDKRRTISKTARRTVGISFVNEIKSLLKEQYDRIIYILEDELKIYISSKLAEEMMSSFIASKAWEYSWTTANNLPWVFGYMQTGKTLIGRLISEKSPLYDAVSKKCKDVQFVPSRKNGYAKLVSKSKFINLHFCIMHHKREIIHDLLNETMEFVITLNDRVIYKDPIKIDESYFLNLINKKENEDKRFRKTELLAIADKYVS